MNILLVEDNEADQRILKEAFTSTWSGSGNLYMVEDGNKALEFVAKKGSYKDVPAPQLILLDLNLPGKSGQDVLSELKSKDETKNIPVIVLTSSTSQDDICECYEKHANCFLTKPTRYGELLNLIRLVCEFWFKNVCLCHPKLA